MRDYFSSVRNHYRKSVKQARQLTSQSCAYLKEGAAALRQASLPRKRIVILSAGRSGSHLLVDLLNSHPRVSIGGELVGKRHRFPKTHVYANLSFRDADYVGFKINTFQLFEVQRLRSPMSFLQDLAAVGWTVIYLKRRNVARQALSNPYALERSRYRSTAADPGEHVDISISTTNLQYWIKRVQMHHALEAELLQGIPYLEIIYERDLASARAQQATSDRLFGSLGLDPVPVSTEGLVTTPRNLQEFVLNADEVLKYLSKEGYTWD